MPRFYCCRDERRRDQVLGTAKLNGIDYLEVVDDLALELQGVLRQRTLLVHFLKPDHLADLKLKNLQIRGGVRVQVGVLWAHPANALTAPEVTAADRNAGWNTLPDASSVLVVRTDAAGDFSPYRLQIITSSSDETPPNGFDPILSEVEFSFKVLCRSDLDCRHTPNCPPEARSEPVLNYLAKDYGTFRRLILDRLATIMPEWKEQNVADIGVALTELLAYEGDRLSYFQDAVATEAYLGTARRRISLRRHARLLDYRMHEGCNARSWVVFKVNGSAIVLHEGTQLLTRIEGLPARLDPGSSDLRKALSGAPLIFETTDDATLDEGLNSMSFYTWTDEACCLPRGATRATLEGDYSGLQQGDVVVLEEVASPETGRAEDADPSHRHAVRLVHVAVDTDPIGNQRYTILEWGTEDALPFPLTLSSWIQTPEGEPTLVETAVARGNVVLADHGSSTLGDALTVPLDGRPFQPRLGQPGLTFAQSVERSQLAGLSARATMDQEPREALPWIRLLEGDVTWQPQLDLLASDRFARDFVVEMDDDGLAHLRFGDGVHGRPLEGGTSLAPVYRIGNGSAGNVGADALAHVVTGEGAVAGVRNPLPAHGGTDPETPEEVRLYAPQAFRVQERAVTEADWSVVAETLAQVQRAQGTLRWTGSWYTATVTVDPQAGVPVTPEFESEMRARLERFRMAGIDLEVDQPRFVPLDIAFAVCVAPDQDSAVVKAALLDAFSNRDLLDGRRGFFHPDNFTFGQPVYLSRIVAEAMRVPGVAWIDTSPSPEHRFQRWGHLSHGELASGVIPIHRLEVARLDNDPSAPENGQIDFEMGGGR